MRGKAGAVKKPRCVWCGSSGPHLGTYPVNVGREEGTIVACGIDCGKNFLGFHNKLAMRGRYMPVGIGLSIGAGVLLAAWRFTTDNGALGVLVAFAGSGASVIALPFTPGLFANLVSPKGAIRVARVFGACLGAAGVVAGGFMWTHRMLG